MAWLTKLKVWFLLVAGAVIAILSGYSHLQRKRRQAEAREWVGVAKAREAKVAAEKAQTKERRAEYVAAKRDYQAYALKAQGELNEINERLQKRRDGRLGELLRRYDESRRRSSN